MNEDFDLGKWDFDRAKAFVTSMRRQGGKIGLTNGCFELFHYGHLEFLKECRRRIPYGNPLMVAVNSDESFNLVKNRKPLMHEHFRRSVVAGMMSVSMAFLWQSMRVTEVIQVLQPEWWFKGGDYTMETLDKGEVAAAEEAGTKIILIATVPGISTSQIIDTIRKTGAHGSTV